MPERGERRRARDGIVGRDRGYPELLGIAATMIETTAAMTSAVPAPISTTRMSQRMNAELRR